MMRSFWFKKFAVHKFVGHKFIVHIIAMLILCFGSGCVSVKLAPPSAPEKAQDVHYKDPAAPFKSSNSKASDRMWISAKTASTISYFTSCSPSEPPLKNIRAAAFSSLENLDITKEEKIQFNGRETLKSDIEGKMEGVPVKVRFLVFKKNSCSYHLSYVALKENFEKEIDQFNNFVKNFKVP
jgi:hypothetical protein